MPTALIIDRQKPELSTVLHGDDPFALMTALLDSMPEVLDSSESEDMRHIFNLMAHRQVEIDTYERFEGTPTPEHLANPERMGRVDPQQYFYNTQRYFLVLK